MLFKVGPKGLTNSEVPPQVYGLLEPSQTLSLDSQEHAKRVGKIDVDYC